jgi:chromosome segregation ATPase
MRSPAHGLDQQQRPTLVRRDRDQQHGKYICHRQADVEAQFAALLARLTASPELVGQIVDGGGVAEEQRALAARLPELRREMADLAARRERVWEMQEAGDLRRDTAQARLDDLSAREERAQAALQRAEEEVATMSARAATADTAQALVEMTAKVWAVAAIEDRKALARALSEALGGLTMTEAGALAIGGLVLVEASAAA